jgi:hypothetical protein
MAKALVSGKPSGTNNNAEDFAFIPRSCCQLSRKQKKASPAATTGGLDGKSLSSVLSALEFAGIQS